MSALRSIPSFIPASFDLQTLSKPFSSRRNFFASFLFMHPFLYPSNPIATSFTRFSVQSYIEGERVSDDTRRCRNGFAREGFTPTTAPVSWGVWGRGMLTQFSGARNKRDVIQSYTPDDKQDGYVDNLLASLLFLSRCWRFVTQFKSCQVLWA